MKINKLRTRAASSNQGRRKKGEINLIGANTLSVWILRTDNSIVDPGDYHDRRIGWRQFYFLADLSAATAILLSRPITCPCCTENAHDAACPWTFLFQSHTR